MINIVLGIILYSIIIIEIIAIIVMICGGFVKMKETYEEYLIERKQRIVFRNFSHKWLTPLYFPNPWYSITSKNNGMYPKKKHRNLKNTKSLSNFYTYVLENIEKNAKQNKYNKNINPGNLVKLCSMVNWDTVNTGTVFFSQKNFEGPNATHTLPRMQHNWVLEINLNLLKDNDKIVPDMLSVGDLDLCYRDSVVKRIDLKLGIIGIYLKDVKITWDKEVYYGFVENFALCMFEGTYYLVRKQDLELA